jgi:cell division protein FtsZ
LSLEIAFRLADDVLRQGVQGIAELITRPGMINVDFAHVRELMLRGGGAYMAIGLGKGEDKANAAIHQALHHPLLEMDSIDTASGVLVHFTGGEDLTLYEVGDAVTNLRDSLSPDADVILGATTEKSMTGRAQAILIFTGVGGRAVNTAASIDIANEEEPVSIAVAQNTDDLDLPTFLRRRVSTGSGS